jgi:hypothetical protein
LTLRGSVCDVLRRRARHRLKICRIMTSLLTIVWLIMRSVLLSRRNEADCVGGVLRYTRRYLRLGDYIFTSIGCGREPGIRVCLIGTRTWLTVCRLHVSQMLLVPCVADSRCIRLRRPVRGRRRTSRIPGVNS